MRGLSLTAPTGGPPRLSNWRNRCFDKAVKSKKLDGLTPHGLRHTSASLAVASGANVKGVQQMLGHQSATMTLDTYADLFDDHLDAVADHLNEAYEQALADSLRTGTDEGTLRNLPTER